jgi:hypothetical protein
MKKIFREFNMIGYHKKWDLRGISPTALGTNPALGTSMDFWQTNFGM